MDCTRESSLTELGWLLRSLSCEENEVLELTGEHLEEIVWGEINNALSEPVERSDDPINYIPTQILSELFKVNGADGIAYKSSVRKGGHNLALFDPEAADIRSCGLHRIKEITYGFEQNGAPWIKQRTE